MQRWWMAALVAASLPSARDAAACASCGCGDPTLTASGVERPYQNRLRLAIEERYGSLATGAGASQERAQFLRSSLAVSWSPIDRLTLQALLPWVTSWIAPTGAPASRLNGLGDLELTARVVVFRERTFAPHHLLWLSAGLKMPTGYRLYDEQGFPYPDDDQPGSGSWDPEAGATYAWMSGELISIFSSVNGRYTTVGRRGYRRGSSLGASSAVQLQPFPWGAIALGIDASLTAADTLDNGQPAPSTGGFIGWFAPALLVRPTGDLLIRLTVDVPLVTALQGTQTAGTQVALSVAYDLH